MASIIDKNNARKLLKPFIFLFLITLIVWNWNSISWVFNYKILSEQLYSFPQENARSNEELGTVKDSIEIPKIDVKAPIIFITENSKEAFEQGLKKGVVHYPDSALPNQKGRTTLLGHSAPDDWPVLGYYKIFSRLDELEEGNKIFIYFNNDKYQYKVTESTIVKPGEEIPFNLTNSQSVVLLTCWPPGKNYKRLAVHAKEVIQK